MSKSWTAADIVKRAKEKGLQVDGIDQVELSKRAERDGKPNGCIFIEEVLDELGVEFIPEFIFDKQGESRDENHPLGESRRFRLDYYLPEFNVGVEYEGVISKDNTVTRHTHITGYTIDCVKYNLAQVMYGIRVLRFTAINYERFRPLMLHIIMNS